MKFKMCCEKKIVQEYASSKKTVCNEVTMSSQVLEIADIQDVKREQIFADNDQTTKRYMAGLSS